MSVTDNYAHETEATTEELPSFDLSYLVDDDETPAEVTVFPASDRYDISTNWITMDVSNTVALEDVR